MHISFATAYSNAWFQMQFQSVKSIKLKEYLLPHSVWFQTYYLASWNETIMPKSMAERWHVIGLSIASNYLLCVSSMKSNIWLGIVHKWRHILGEGDQRMMTFVIFRIGNNSNTEDEGGRVSKRPRICWRNMWTLPKTDLLLLSRSIKELAICLPTNSYWN